MFDAHVIAGYSLITKYYKDRDKISLFGFSRGAFTARFLPRMIYKVGLLFEGKEMVTFAYDPYQQYEIGNLSKQEKKKSPPTKELANKATQSPENEQLLPNTVETDPYMKPNPQQLKINKLIAFKETFRRSEGADNTEIIVYFLGMFDCISSVLILERQQTFPSRHGSLPNERCASCLDDS